jgi:magnesium chelatase subunit D
VPLAGGGDPWQQTLQLAAVIKQMHIMSLVLDTENGYLRFGRANELAAVLGAECLSLDTITSEKVTRTISEQIHSLTKA